MNTKRKIELPLPKSHKCSGCKHNYIEECPILIKGKEKECKRFEWD